MKEIQRTAGGDITRVLAYRDNYSYQTRQWVRWMQQTGQRIDETGIREYFRWLNDDSKLAAGTIRNRRSAVKKRVRQLYADAPPETKMRIEQILTDIDADFSTAAPTVQPEPVSSDRILSPTEYREALLRCRTDRQRCFLMVLWESGMRVSEATGITLDRCELTPEVVRCRILGKGRKERTVRIRRELYDYCRDVFRGSVYLLETAGGQRYERAYISAEIRRAGSRIGRKISAHSMRHSWATRMVERVPGKIDAVSRYLGHSDPAVTLGMYCHATLSDGELFDAEIAQ